MNLLTRHLTGLADFKGRENRQPFWLWILIVYAVQFVVSLVAIFAILIPRMQQLAQAGQGDPAYLDTHPEIMAQMMTAMMSGIMTYSTIAAIVTVVLIGAATVRRLHDGDHAGWWALPVFVAQVGMPLLYVARMPKFLEVFSTIKPGMRPDEINVAMAPAMQSMAWVSLLGMITFLMVIVLIVFLALKGTEGPNRYGPDPLAIG